MLTSPLKWHGGKFYLRSWHISLMPPHLHYVEPYFGGGSVLLGKPCTGISEVANDIFGDLVNFWKVLADPATFEQFQRRAQATPFSEQLWEESKGKCSPSTEKDVEAALNFFIYCRQSRQGLMEWFASLTQRRTRASMNEQTSAWMGVVENLPAIHARLMRVALRNRPAVEIIEQEDAEQTFFYLDPPYLPDTRIANDAYEFEMSFEQHEELLAALIDIKGKFMLCGYPSELYREVAETCGWHVCTKEIDNKASSKAVKPKKTECVWMNYIPPIGKVEA